MEAVTNVDNDQRLRVHILHTSSGIDFDEFILIWLDSQLDTSEDCREAKRKLRYMVNTLLTFSDVDACLNFLNAKPIEENERHICLIVSGAFSSQVFASSLIHAPEIITLAIYCFHTENYKAQGRDVTKLLGVFDELDPLLCALQRRLVDFRKTYSVGSSLLFKPHDNSIKSLSQENATFMWFHLLLQALYRLPRTDEARFRMIQACINHYADNTTQLRVIEEFKDTYKPDQCVNWYTRDSFVYRIINRALRKQNIETIFTFFPFIGDLHDQVITLHDEFLEFGPSPTLTVYHGQHMKIDELQKIKENLNGLLSMNSFFSTSFDRNVSRCFALKNDDIKVVSILYEIIIDTDVSAAPFSNVDGHSLFNSEQEILFSADAIFRVESAEEKTDEHGQFWLIKLRLVDERMEQPLTDLIDHFKKDMGNNTSLLTLSNLLQHMGDLEGAERFILLMQESLPSDDTRQALVYDQLGIINMYNNERQPLLLLEKALQIYESTDTTVLPERDILMANTLMNIAHIHDKNCDYVKASDYHARALELQLGVYGSSLDNKHILTSLANIGGNFYRQGRIQDALEAYQSVITLAEHVVPSKHPDMSIVHADLGVIHSQLGNVREAIWHHEQSHVIRIAVLPEGHEKIARSHCNLAWRLIDNSNYIEARKHFESALEIDERNDSRADPAARVNTLTGLAAVARRQGHLDESLQYLQRAQRLLPSANHPEMNQIQQQLGKVFGLMERYDEAQTAFKLALNNCNNEFERSEILLSTGQLLCRMGKHEEALESFQQALQIRRQAKPDALAPIGKLLYEIAHVLFQMQRFTEALDYFCQCLDLEEQSLPENHVDKAHSHHSIATVLLKLNRYDQALSHAQRALDIGLQNLNKTDPLIRNFQQLKEVISSNMQK